MIRNFTDKAPVIGHGVYIDATAVVIGDVTIGDDCSIWPHCVIRGDVNTITIGAGTNIQDGSILHVTHDGPYTDGGSPLTIGNNNIIGHKVILHGCQIEDHCLIGMGCIIMDNVIIESQLILAAGSLVPPGKKLSSGFLWRGSPATKVRPLTDAELESLEYSANFYQKLKNRYLEDQGSHR